MQSTLLADHDGDNSRASGAEKQVSLEGYRTGRGLLRLKFTKLGVDKTTIQGLRVY